MLFTGIKLMQPFYSPALAAKLFKPDVRITNDSILAALKKCRYPVLTTTKWDGIRALRFDCSLISRTRKQIPNRVVRERSLIMPGGFDTEAWHPSLDYNGIQSIVMSEEHELSDEIVFKVLDWYKEGTYHQRTYDVAKHMKLMGSVDRVQFEEPLWCENAEQLFQFFLKTEAEHGEGFCFRLPNSPYKQGYSTLNEQYLVKLARFIYEEAIIVGFEEQFCNANPEQRNALGKMKRSSSQANLYGKNTLGALWVTANGITFKVASGFTDALRKHVWLNQSKYTGMQITYKHKPHGKLNKPRSPVFVGFRKEGF